MAKISQSSTDFKLLLKKGHAKMNLAVGCEKLQVSIDQEWFAYSRTNSEARIRLFCFPYAGGGALSYRTWSEAVPAQIDIRPIQLPGRENRFNEKPYTEMQTLVDALSTAIRPYLDMPFAFFGHSMGSLLAFELAKKLDEEGLATPRHLFISSRRGPDLPGPTPPLHTLSESELVDTLKRFGGIPDLILKEPEILDFFLPTLRADLYLAETSPLENGIRIDAPITAFGGLQDPFTSVDELEAWRKHTLQEFRLKIFPGGHFYMREQNRVLLKEISHTLAKHF
jgi:medium-chain acyl-[acyl-carrier-protein] hydrolase